MEYHGESLKFDEHGNPEVMESEWVEVRKSRIHGTGLYAKKDIPKGTRVLEYVGEKLGKKEAGKRCDQHLEMAKKNPNKGGVYVFELDKNYDIDGFFEWNTARLINHSCEPNCETEENDKYIWIIAVRDIKKGEEITYNYGYDLDNWQDHPCKCGSNKCVGYIVDEKHWKKLKKEVKEV
jgi:hypothetical protein